MKYSAEQKIYFQLEIVTFILDEIETEVCDIEMDEQLCNAKDLIQEISHEAYRKASKV